MCGGGSFVTAGELDLDLLEKTLSDVNKSVFIRRAPIGDCSSILLLITQIKLNKLVVLTDIKQIYNFIIKFSLIKTIHLALK